MEAIEQYFLKAGFHCAVVVKVIINNLMKIKLRESEAEHRFSYDSIAYDHVKTTAPESESEAKE